jgi:hypothetical protein
MDLQFFLSVKINEFICVPPPEYDIQRREKKDCWKKAGKTCCLIKAFYTSSARGLIVNDFIFQNESGSTREKKFAYIRRSIRIEGGAPLLLLPFLLFSPHQTITLFPSTF